MTSLASLTLAALCWSSAAANFFDFLYRPQVQYVPEPEQRALLAMDLGFEPQRNATIV